MNRRRYIRFFISSTFADMNIERNLLKGVFSKLKYYCESKGWQLETIDLRWGVSKEAGLDNKTMRICLSELKRCQELSPKPNFIILLGDRYGWIPLPEIISVHDAEQIISIATYTEQTLFKRWYMLDNNVLPDGVYVLGGRRGQFCEQAVYAQTVELPLRNLFRRYAQTLQDETHRIPFERSATEQEIQQGAMVVSDASEHVLAYFRQMHDIPVEEQSLFCQSGVSNQTDFEQEALSRLKQRIKNKLKPNNVYCENINYTYYHSPEYAVHFADEMEHHLQRIIDREIEENEVCSHQYEQAEHLEYAQKEAATFVGRTTVLKVIDAYLNDEKRNNTLWVQAPSGIGKSALLAKVVEIYNGHYDIICRFCGTTPQSCDGVLLLCSIWEELKGLYELNWVTTELAEVKNRVHYSFLGSMNTVEMFEMRLRQLKLRRPLLIVIDALNQLDVEETPWLPRLEWLNGELAPGLKVIISTVNSHEYSFMPSRIEVLPLQGMGTEAARLVKNVLTLDDRCLQPAQWDRVEEVISLSDRSPLFLNLLGKYLCGITSYQTIHELPADFEGLVKLIVNNLLADENHGELMVRLSLSLLVSDRLGLTSTEIVELISLDEDFGTLLKESSYYQWDADEGGHSTIPPVLWSRLYNDLSYFLRVRNTIVGELIYIHHDELRRIICNLFLDHVWAKPYIYSLLYNYYSKKWPHGDKHALYEVGYCCYQHIAFMSHHPAYNRTSNLSYWTELLYSLLHNISFLMQKSQVMSLSLSEDFERLITLMRSNRNTKESDIESVLRLKNDVLELAGMEEEQFYSLALNAPLDSPLQMLANRMEGREHYLRNVLRDIMPSSRVLYRFNERGESPCLNADGTRLVSLFDNRHKVHLKNFKDERYSITYTLSDKIIDFAADSSLNRHALLSCQYCLLYDLNTHETIVQSSEISNACWVSLSADGNVFAYGGHEGVYIHGYGVFNFDAPQGMLAPSGNYLWMITNGILCRFELITRKSRTLLLELVNENSLIDIHAHIGSCTDHLCYVVGDDMLVFIATFETPEGKAQFSYQVQNVSSNSVFTAIREDERQVLMVDEIGNYHLIQLTDYKINKSDDKDYSGKVCPLACISHNFSVALPKYENAIYDLNELKGKFAPNDAPNAGINSLSASASGNLIGVSTGKNKLIDCFAEMLLIVYDDEHFSAKLWPLPGAKPYLYIAGSCIAPDGSFIVASTFGDGVESGKGQIIVANGDGTLINIINVESGSCTAIAISADSRYVLAGTGHYIANVDSVLYLLTREGMLLDVINRHTDFTLEDKIWISANNRYAIVGEFFFGVIDLISGELMARDYVSIVIHPSGSFALLTNRDSLNVLDLASGEVETAPYDKEILGFTTSGRYLFVVDKEGRLFRKAIFIAAEVYLMDDVSYVIPTFDETHLFVLKKNSNICLIDIFSGAILQTAYFGQVHHLCMTTFGLCVVNPKGEVALFTPEAKLRVNKTAFVTIVKPWNLETKQQEQNYVATCPLCGTNFRPSKELLNAINELDDAEAYMDEGNCLWDDIRLIGHNCPHCRGNLRFNPYSA